MRSVWFNEGGRRIGESHHRAKLSDTEVEQICAMREAGMSYGKIAKKFDDIPGGIAKSTVRDICTGRIRAQFCARIKRLPDAPARHKKAPNEHNTLGTQAG